MSGTTFKRITPQTKTDIYHIKAKNYGFENSSCFFKELKRLIIICKWHSLAIYILNFVKDSSVKNNGISIFILVDICIQK